MTVTLKDPRVVSEIEQLMQRFQLPAETVLERLILEAGAWIPMELLAHPPMKTK